MIQGKIGFIDTPRQRNIRPPGVTWCADNGCFSDKWDQDYWWEFLVRHSGEAGSCVFAVAPDVVGDAEATLELSRPWLPKIRRLGYPVAFVLQDGQEDHPVPWDEFDVAFIGGGTEWKTGRHARHLAAFAKGKGKWVHMGRVNSYRRMDYARSIRCDSVDGTHLVFEPTRALPRVLKWVDAVNAKREWLELDLPT